VVFESVQLVNHTELIFEYISRSKVIEYTQAFFVKTFKKRCREAAT
jgi:hypothetical protein